MPTSADAPLLVDTSVAVALAVADHEGHHATAEALSGRPLGLAGHAWFETYSVLTRLPAPTRRPPAEVVQLLTHNFPHTSFLHQQAQHELSQQLAELGIAGGSVYDALVAAVAAREGSTLATRDRRALDTYQRLGVALLLVS